MRYTQLVTFEIAAVCKYAPIHLFCPAHKRVENALKKPPQDDAIADFVQQLHADHGFRGFVGFHYYCEPMQDVKRMQALIDLIRKRVDNPRFLLWSNAREHLEKPPFDLGQFEQVHLSMYKEQTLDEQITAARNVSVQCPGMYAHGQKDDLRAGPARIPMLGHCLRPFLEMCVEYDGSVRMCCQDWRPDDPCVGNISEGTSEIVRKWRETRRKLIDNGTRRFAMSREAPVVCKVCANKYLVIDSIDPQIAEETARYAASLLKEGGNDVRGQAECAEGRVHGSGAPGANRFRSMG